MISNETIVSAAYLMMVNCSSINTRERYRSKLEWIAIYPTNKKMTKKRTLKKFLKAKLSPCHMS